MVVKINYEFFKVFKEIILLLKVSFIKKRGGCKKSGRVLIVNPCLIGDFMVSMHAINRFIRNHNFKVDLMVSPPLKELAEKIVGVRKVFVAKSVFDREIEGSNEKAEKLNDYDT